MVSRLYHQLEIFSYMIIHKDSDELHLLMVAIVKYWSIQ